jgi:hypothetical protein
MAMAGSRASSATSSGGMRFIIPGKGDFGVGFEARVATGLAALKRRLILHHRVHEPLVQNEPACAGKGPVLGFS